MTEISSKEISEIKIERYILETLASDIEELNFYSSKIIKVLSLYGFEIPSGINNYTIIDNFLKNENNSKENFIKAYEIAIKDNIMTLYNIYSISFPKLKDIVSDKTFKDLIEKFLINLLNTCILSYDALSHLDDGYKLDEDIIDKFSSFSEKELLKIIKDSITY